MKKPKHNHFLSDPYKPMDWFPGPCRCVIAPVLDTNATIEDSQKVIDERLEQVEKAGIELFDRTTTIWCTGCRKFIDKKAFQQSGNYCPNCRKINQL